MCGSLKRFKAHPNLDDGNARFVSVLATLQGFNETRTNAMR